MTRIGIDLARRIGTVDRRIFGNFIEHLGRCIYGGIFEEGSPLSDARGLPARTCSTRFARCACRCSAGQAATS